MGALRTLKRKHKHGKRNIGDAFEYPPRQVFICDCGEHFTSADDLSTHAGSCESVPEGEYPKGEARVARFEAICRRLKRPFGQFIAMLSVAEASFIVEELSDQELADFIVAVYSQYGVFPEDVA